MLLNTIQKHNSTPLTLCAFYSRILVSLNISTYWLRAAKSQCNLQWQLLASITATLYMLTGHRNQCHYPFQLVQETLNHFMPWAVYRVNLASCWTALSWSIQGYHCSASHTPLLPHKTWLWTQKKKGDAENLPSELTSTRAKISRMKVGKAFKQETTTSGLPGIPTKFPAPTYLQARSGELRIS